MGLDWQKWAKEDLGLSLDEIASVNISRDLAPIPSIEILLDTTSSPVWLKKSHILDTGKIALTAKSGTVYVASIDWKSETIIS